MDAAELKQLAEEREARARARGPMSEPMPNPWPKAAPARQPAAAGRPGGGAGAASALSKAHRSIRLAHSVACIWCCIGLLMLLLMSNRWWGVVSILVGVVLARSGGGVVHGALPAMLQESGPPSEQELESATCVGLFCGAGLMQPGESLAEEWTVFLENLAFICTYGKRNCLTNQMYSGDLTFGKITSLVWGKLSSGVVQCN
eukprot:TRINITY_DN70961_c0_g1_i1.p1 TRINITY_DN70961_c0_g1~~TRINITY_DN70961_c0_g1_i1.p1  ORF type:complete len:202 (+),score=34.80 TRINITY_DN70961_c0_g1_i1:59-664(+)